LNIADEIRIRAAVIYEDFLSISGALENAKTIDF
jgi:hypothetical protein